MRFLGGHLLENDTIQTHYFQGSSWRPVDWKFPVVDDPIRRLVSSPTQTLVVRVCIEKCVGPLAAMLHLDQEYRLLPVLFPVPRLHVPLDHSESRYSE